MKLCLCPKTRCMQVFLALAILFLFPYVLSRAASPWRCVRVCYRSMDAGTKKASSPTPGAIRVATYNIAHGRGLAESNWRGGSPEDRRDRLDRIAQLLRELDADVIVLNEVDFDSSWSHGINQAEYLAQKAGYPYHAEQRNLDFRLLFWKWRFGNAVLSRHPIEQARVVSFPGFSQCETLLAGKKRGLLCTIDAPSNRFCLVAAHLSHRSESLRVQSAKMIMELAANENLPMVVAGDLNSTPPGFPQSGQNEQGGNAIACFDASEKFKRHPDALPEAGQLTFSSSQPQAVIDWILIPIGWNFREYRAIDSRLSDHRPVMAVVGAKAERSRE